MEEEGNERLPEFPSSPDGIARMEHLPTVESSIRYWEAVRAQAIEAGQPALELTATALLDSYERARQELTNAERSQNEKAPPRARTGRPQTKPSRDHTIED